MYIHVFLKYVYCDVKCVSLEKAVDFSILFL